MQAMKKIDTIHGISLIVDSEKPAQWNNHRRYLESISEKMAPSEYYVLFVPFTAVVPMTSAMLNLASSIEDFGDGARCKAYIFYGERRGEFTLKEKALRFKRKFPKGAALYFVKANEASLFS